MSKLSSYGVGGKILKWIQEFLCGRTQYVAVRKDRSAEAEVTSGVPQGSVLGPLLFIIYINDLPGNVESNAQMFADDTKVFTHINSQDDVKRLQTDMDKLLEWSRTWLLKFNATKCKVMHMGNSNPGGNYTMDGVVLEEIESEKDLGVYITKDSKPSTQCTKAAQKAMNSLRLIKRTFKYFDHDAFQTLYRTYIRPHLEYSVPAWNPGMKKDIKVLEKVQRRATKLVPELRDMSYKERLDALGLYTLETRRLRCDLIETYKIMHGLEKVNVDKFFKLADTKTTQEDTLSRSSNPGW